MTGTIMSINRENTSLPENERGMTGEAAPKDDDPSRREFLQTTFGGAVAAGTLIPLEAARAPAAGPAPPAAAETAPMKLTVNGKQPHLKLHPRLTLPEP